MDITSSVYFTPIQQVTTHSFQNERLYCLPTIYPSFHFFFSTARAHCGGKGYFAGYSLRYKCKPRRLLWQAFSIIELLHISVPFHVYIFRLSTTAKTVSVSCLFVLFSAFVGTLAAPTTLEEENADFILTNRKSLVKRQDYTRNYKTGGNVQLSTTTDEYSLTFSGAAYFVVGRGWKAGNTR